jgi:hypothetical protein
VGSHRPTCGGLLLRRTSGPLELGPGVPAELGPGVPAGHSLAEWRSCMSVDCHLGRL